MNTTALPVSQQTTVFGVPLEDGERVIFYQRIHPLPERVFMVLVGIPLILMFGFGLYLIYGAIKHRKGSIYAQVVTTERLLSIDGFGTPNFAVRWSDVGGLYEKRKGGGLQAFGVQDRSGHRFVFLKNLGPLREFLRKAAVSSVREQLPGVAFDSNVL